ncbi:MAG: IPT/TIG domain-containing protein [Planctomycetota bacterium]
MKFTGWLSTAVLSVVSVLSTAEAALARDEPFEMFKVTASDAAASDRFGTAVDTDGSVAIIGSSSDDDAGSGSGSAYLFDVATGQQLFKLTASNAGASDRFGISVAIDGITAIVGADQEDSGASGSGSAYLFDVATAQELFHLTPADADSGKNFGNAVAISGNLAIVGAFQDRAVANQAGAAYVFDVTTGQQLFKLTASDAASGDFFGSAVAISGNLALVGASGDDPGGAAYVFDLTTGQELLKLSGSDTVSSDLFGSAVALEGSTALIGARGRDDDGNSSGAAYVFDASTGQELFKLRASDASEADLFGVSVSLSGGLAIIGSYLDDDGGNETGSAYVFDVTSGQELSKLRDSDATAGDRFGETVSIANGYAIVGAASDDAPINSSGSAILFDADGDTTPPGSVGNLQSTSHLVDVWSSSTNVMLSWTAATDDISGVDGYSVLFDQSPTTQAPEVKVIEETELAYSETRPTSIDGHYFHIRAVDACGNWGDTLHAGPFWIDTEAPTNGTVRIASGLSSTPGLIVRLTDLGATEPASGLADIQFSNDGSDWTNQGFFSETREAWDLSTFGGDTTPGTKTVYVRYFDAAGNVSASFSDTIEYTPRPKLTNITPNRGSSAGGNTITLVGSGFTPDTAVTFGGAAGTVSFVSDTELQVTVPASPVSPAEAGSPRRLAVDAEVVVTTPHGSDSAVNGYTYTFKR